MLFRSQAFRTSINALLNGDWRTLGQVEHYCNGCCASREVTLRRCYTHLVKGFTGRAIKIFPRTNWCGADETLDSIGIFVVAHNLFWMTFAVAFGGVQLADLRGATANPDARAAAADAIVLDDEGARRAR